MTVTFLNLTRHEFEAENCSECFILVDLHLVCVSDVPRDLDTYINSSVTYDPVYIQVREEFHSVPEFKKCSVACIQIFQDLDSLIIGPTVRLSVLAIRPEGLLLPGEEFEVNFTITLDPVSRVDIVQILGAFLEYPEEYLLPGDNFTVIYGNGEVEVFGE